MSFSRYGVFPVLQRTVRLRAAHGFPGLISYCRGNLYSLWYYQEQYQYSTSDGFLKALPCFELLSLRSLNAEQLRLG